MRKFPFFIAVLSVLLTACSSVAEEKPTEDALPWKVTDNQQENDNKQNSLAQGEEREQVIKEISDYLNNLTTMVSPFVQLAPNGKLSSGTFYLSRPGRLRWEYEPPIPIEIVANNGTVTYLDKELEQISHISVDETPLAFLLDKIIQLQQGDIVVTNVRRHQNLIEIVLEQESEDVQGSISLIFKDKPLELKKFSLTDATGSNTVITFTGAVYHQTLDKALFTVRDPRLYRDKRN